MGHFLGGEVGHSQGGVGGRFVVGVACVDIVVHSVVGPHDVAEPTMLLGLPNFLQSL